jgi:hypothetical protein
LDAYIYKAFLLWCKRNTDILEFVIELPGRERKVKTKPDVKSPVCFGAVTTATGKKKISRSKSFT